MNEKLNASSLRGDRRARASILGVFVLFVVSTVGCAHDGDAKQKAPEVRAAVEFYPLAVGNRWTYQVKAGSQPEQPPPLVVTIVEKNSDGYYITDRSSRVRQHPEGIFDGNRFLLQDPMTRGHKWMAVQDATSIENYEIMETDLDVSTPSGFYSDCLKVIGTTNGKTPDGQKFILETEWIWAPNVGIVRLVQRATSEGAPPIEMTRMELTRFESATKKLNDEQP